MNITNIEFYIHIDFTMSVSCVLLVIKLSYLTSNNNKRALTSFFLFNYVNEWDLITSETQFTQIVDVFSVNIYMLNCQWKATNWLIEHVLSQT